MTINLRAITRDNYRDIIVLQVAPEQERFVASNLLTIAQMQFKEEKIALGIYDGNTPVGLIAYDLDDYDIWRLMIDHRYQGNGYAKQALEMVLGILQNHGKLREVRTSVVPENSIAKKLYESVGFRENGEILWIHENGEPGEIVLVLPMDS